MIHDDSIEEEGLHSTDLVVDNIPGHGMVTHSREGIFKPTMKYALRTDIHVPTHSNLNCCCKKSHYWKDGMDSEIKALQQDMGIGTTLSNRMF